MATPFFFDLLAALLASMTEPPNGGMLHIVECAKDKQKQAEPINTWTRAGLFTASFLVYMSCTGPGAYWIDSGELAAAGATLGIAHPPGHPLYAILAYLASLVPIGAMGFRIALLSGVLASLSVVLVYDLVLLCAHKTKSQRTLNAFAALAALTFAGCGGLVLQAVRAEVYTLNLVLLLFALRMGLQWKYEAPSFDTKTMLRVSFVCGLALANHHLLVVAFLPALFLWLLHHKSSRSLARAHWLKLILMGLSGLLLYAYLPLRTLTDPLLNFGDPRTLGRFIDVLMAKSFQASVGGEEVNLSQNIEAAFSMLGNSVGISVVFASVLGTILLYRSDKWLALTLLLAVTANLATKLVMVLDPDNPDAAGYFLITMALMAVLTGVALSLLMSVPRRGAKAASVILSAAVLLTCATTSAQHLEQHDLSETRSTAIIDAWMLKDMPPGSVLMPIHPHLYFNRLYHASIDAYRPDLLAVHQSMDRRIENGAPFAAYMGRRDPELEPLLSESLATGRFPLKEVQDLAKKRPVYVEPHNQIEGDIPLDTLGKAGLYSRIHPTTDAAAQNRRGVTFNELRTLLRPNEEFNNDEKRMIGYLAASVAIVRLKQGHAVPAYDALQGLQKVFPGQDFANVEVRWGPHTQTLGVLVQALLNGERSGRQMYLEQVRAFARNCDYSGLLPN